MRRKILWLASNLLILFQLVAGPQQASAATQVMIFCNGNMASVDGLTTTQINGYRASGLTTMIIFTMGVASNGDFTYGGVLCSNGVYLGPTNWGSLLNQCRTAPSTVNRIEMCIGAWGDTSWANIKNYIAANGTNSNTALYKNLLALKNALGIDAIDNDDEGTYDSASTIQFGKMCASVGLKLTLCPYTNLGYWQAVKAGLDTNTCDQVYLQCYDGGKYNDPASWNPYFGGLKVVPGYWDWERDTTFLTKMQAWSAAGSGGFLWPSDTGGNPPAGPGEMKQYADWILNTFNPTVTPATAADVVGSQVTFKTGAGSSDRTYQWQVIRNGVTNNISGATNTTLTLANLQLTNTASYQVRVSNAEGVTVSGASSLTVSGVSPAVNNVITSYAAQTGLGFGFSLTPTWIFAPGDIIYGQVPSSTNGNFSMDYPGRSVNSLTDGGSGAITLITGASGTFTSTNYVTCGNAIGAGSLVVYTLTNLSASGYNLTNITVYGGWRDAGRDQQAYTVYYSKVASPTTFILLGRVNYNPANVVSVPSVTRAVLRPATGWLATNVAAVKFDFTNPASENDYCGYSEIALYGVPLSPAVATNTLPATAADVVGSQVSFTAAFNSINPLNYQWKVIKAGMTNNIPGETNQTLILTNLQLTNTASYQLQASNANGVALSAPSSLTVSSVPAAVNNVITTYAAQTGFGSALTNFVPTWTVAPDSLIAGQSPSSVGGGNFSLYYGTGVVGALTDGTFGSLNFWPGVGSSTTEVICGTVAGGAGQSVTYTLTGPASGYSLTNIVVYGGWGDSGRDQQAYTVYYSTVTAPTTFIKLGIVNYNPVNAAGVQSATRATLKGASDFLATNVAALKLDFTTPAPENDSCGYSELALFGVPSIAPVATNPTNITVQLTANNLTLTWPGDHLGWRLQAQTNDLAQGLSTNWWDVDGSTLTNQISTSISPDKGSVFYRMIYP